MVLPRGTSYLRADFWGSSFFIGIIERKILTQPDLCEKSNGIYSRAFPREKIWEIAWKMSSRIGRWLSRAFTLRNRLNDYACYVRCLYTFVTINQNCFFLCFFRARFLFLVWCLAKARDPFQKKLSGFRERNAQVLDVIIPPRLVNYFFVHFREKTSRQRSSFQFIFSANSF